MTRGVPAFVAAVLLLSASLWSLSAPPAAAAKPPGPLGTRELRVVEGYGWECVAAWNDKDAMAAAGSIALQCERRPHGQGLALQPYAGPWRLKEPQ